MIHIHWSLPTCPCSKESIQGVNLSQRNIDVIENKKKGLMNVRLIIHVWCKPQTCSYLTSHNVHKLHKKGGIRCMATIDECDQLQTKEAKSKLNALKQKLHIKNYNFISMVLTLIMCISISFNNVHAWHKQQDKKVRHGSHVRKQPVERISFQLSFH